ncbi:MAG: helix-turn-helix domain-containing protein [Fusobacterium sp.]|nr:helix-turn-helix domain-containing protein [Fusobacterium sp.]
MISERVKKIGLKIKLERTKRGLSREKLAEMADLHASTIGTIERGEKEPSITTLEQIATALGVEFDDLINISKFEL